jgi:peptide/nickel transport system substrate-binding protein
MILREAFDYEFSPLDPHAAHIDPPSVAVYETVIVKGPDWGSHPLLAQDWQVSDDGLEWRVALRPNLRFHSGTPCDAQAVIRALDALRTEAQPDRDLWYWDPVKSLSAADDRTLVFRLNHRYGRLPALLWGTHTAVYNDIMRRDSEAAFGRAVADGTGPFRLVSWSPERIVAERWDGYPGAPASFLEAATHPLQRIEWVSILDERERLGALEAGDVDCLHGPPLDEVARLAEDPRFTVIEYPQPSNMYLALDWRQTALGFEDVRVRRALSLAIDRPELVEQALHGRATAAFGPIPPGDEFYVPAIDREGVHDRALAAELLDAAGFALGPDGVRAREGQRLAFDCVVQDDAVFRRVAALIRDQLAQVGVVAELRPVRPFAPFYEAVAAGPAASISKWLWQDPLDAAIGFTDSSNRPFPNWQHASVPELDRAYQGWLRATSAGELRSAAEHAGRVFAATLPYVPLLTPNDIWVHGAHVHGYRPFPANLYPFYQGVSLDARGG